MTDYHVPVLLHESIDLLQVKKDGIYVDVTFGAGGHSREILSRLGPEGKLLVFDQDFDAISNMESDERLVFIDSNFRYLKQYLQYYKIESIDGLLADLGVSSHQFDTQDRGFSYRFDAELDMRMNQEMELTANDVLQNYSEQDLVEVFSKYGEVRNSKTLARKIHQERQSKVIWTTQRFNALLSKTWMNNEAKYFAQVYQALRIEVNDEMNALKEMLEAATEYLRVGGRLVVISYHSLEDRITKHLMKKGNVEGKMIQDDFGNIYRPFKIITKQVVTSGKEELNRNSRAASAKLRAAEKI